MEFVNATRIAAGYNVGLEASGRELLVVVVKGTFVLPKAGEETRLHERQLPLVMVDTFTGKPGLSAPLYEMDFAARKRACDVLLIGSAHAPDGRQATRVRVGVRVGPMNKSFDVVGDRIWRSGVRGISVSEPQPFARMPISYDVAFGGADLHSDDQSQHDAYPSNPVGRGWHKYLKAAWVDGRPLPNTQAIEKAVASPSGTYEPMALGPLGRAWRQRSRFAGTYDQTWLDNVFPFLPKDFDERYYQTAPEDQQLPVPTGPIGVELTGLTSDGIRRFILPHFEAPVRVFPRTGGREDYAAKLDTIVFEPDEERFALTWRLTRPLKKSLHEIAQVVAGRDNALSGHPVKLAACELSNGSAQVSMAAH
ncbi:DUF2169 family type VI secretion system accessory protein [Caballeronia grimmiae]|uniref:DUF2169 domain-containing protein n=1 Tax=Caballeronia grimmiae TaxID=1071679 RepID=A0A069NA96_9BURK|nr:DUF2169 domain-containing protein [Caballeronia grimmiae]KDR25348.1 hypothetical protein BG57_30710 [Caballeronia grimmiae]GGD74537.1 hypothetical protein GCM10010985_31250 [Caballeronia grimmiae]